MRVNHQIYVEMTKYIQLRRDFIYQINSQYAGLCSLAVLTYKGDRYSPDFSQMKDLVIEILPPHPDRPIDIVHIWRRVQKLCNELHAMQQVHDLSVHFKEDSIATWSINSIPHQTAGICINPKKPEEAIDCDVGQMLMLFARLTNVTKARIILPPSLRTNKSLKRFARTTHGTMTGLLNLNRAFLEFTFEVMEADYTDNEPEIRMATGRKSKQRFERIYPFYPVLPIDEYQAFTKQWPCLSDLPRLEHPVYQRRELGQMDHIAILSRNGCPNVLASVARERSVAVQLANLKLCS